MNLERRYQRTACTAVLLAIAAYATAAGWIALAIIAIPLVIALWRVSSAPAGEHPLFLLPRWIVNTLLGAALAYAAWRTASRGPDVEGVAELVILLQMIKLGDRRSARDDAQIIALSVFLAIAAMLTSNEIWVGLLLLGFLPALTLAVMLHQLYAGLERSRPAPARALSAPTPTPPARVVVGRRFGAHLRSVGVLALACALVSSVFVFVLMPRGIGQDQFGRWPITQTGQVTGFSDTVELGAGGLITQSPEVVLDMEVRSGTGENLGAPDTLHYLRGAVLDGYSNGRWERLEPPRDLRGRGRPSWTETSPATSHTFGETQGPARLIQTVRFRGLRAEGRPLLHVWRPVRFEWVSTGQVIFHDDGRSEDGRLNVRTGRIRPPRDGRMMPLFEYRVTSAILPPGRIREQRPQVQAIPSERISALAAEILTGAGLNPDPATRPVQDDLAVAETIEDYLRRTYRYTLNEHQSPDGSDPIEHFLFSTREGHCEYFASAMTALCRAVGINARMAVGYLAAEYNPSAETYTVRESNAHAWVEAEIGVDGWRRYDPTPAAEIDRLHRPRLGLLGRFRQWIDAIEFLWNSRVVSFDERARERVIGRGADGSGSGFLAGLDRQLQRIRAGGPRLVRDAALGAIAVFVLVAALGSAGVVLVRAARARSRRRPARVAPGRADPALAARLAQARFYQQLLDALERRGHPKPAWRPPLEHAAALAPIDPPLGAAAAMLGGLYYRVRFGAADLTDVERTQAEAVLAGVTATAND